MMLWGGTSSECPPICDGGVLNPKKISFTPKMGGHCPPNPSQMGGGNCPPNPLSDGG